MRIDGPWIRSAPAEFVWERLTDRGHRALFVGGAVRNAVLGLPVKDFDVATDAVPESVVAAFDGADVSISTHGILFGTVMVVRNELPIEITTFRRDIETDGRRACVAFSDRIEDDAARRDFTMNAIYAEFDGTLVDPLGGLSDLLERRIRFVGSARERIFEDRLRMLRLFRFQAHFGHPDAGIDPEAEAAVRELAGGISIVSAERITTEMLNLLGASKPGSAVSSMAATGLLGRVLPGAEPGLLPRLERLERELNVLPDSLRRLAAIGGDAGSLRLDRRSAARLRRLSTDIGPETVPEALGYRFGVQDGLGIALLRAARTGSAPPGDLQERLRSGARQRFPVKAAHLPAELEGETIGNALRELEGRWLESGFSMTDDELLATLDSGAADEAVGR